MTGGAGKATRSSVNVQERPKVLNCHFPLETDQTAAVGSPSMVGKVGFGGGESGSMLRAEVLW